MPELSDRINKKYVSNLIYVVRRSPEIKEDKDICMVRGGSADSHDLSELNKVKKIHYAVRIHGSYFLL